MREKFGSNHLKELQMNKEDLKYVTIDGAYSFYMSAVTFGATSNDPGLIKFPK